MPRRSSLPVELVASTPEPVRSDADLVRAFVDGEAWAARAIWNRHAAMVFRLIDRTLGPAAEAEDLTQEVFVQTFAKLPGLREPNALRSFVYSVSIRTLKWELRRRRVRRILRLSDPAQLPEVAVKGEDGEAREMLTRFYRVLDALGASDRTVFVLRYMEELRLEEIAARMEVSLATAKRWLKRATGEVSSRVDADEELTSYLRERGGFDVRQ